MDNQDSNPSYAIDIMKSLRQVSVACIAITERAMVIEGQIPKADNEQLKSCLFKMVLAVGAMIVLTEKNHKLIDKYFPAQTSQLSASDAESLVH